MNKLSHSEKITRDIEKDKDGLNSVTVIKPENPGIFQKLVDLWRYRELLYFLIWRDIKVRYKQTALGAAWAIIQPLLTTLIFSIFLGRLAKVPSDGVPYPIFSYTALVPWTFFANGISLASNSLVGSANLITKVYFPRLVIPLGSILAGLLDLVLAFVFLLGLLTYYKIWPTSRMFLLPLFILLAVTTAVGVALWLSALNVKYRDVRYAVPFLIQFWLFATPVAYPSSLLSEPWRTLYGLNPMVGVVDGFRWAILGTELSAGMLIFSTLSAIVFFLSGIFYFSRVEAMFADVI